jgi:hypothetical protein
MEIYAGIIDAAERTFEFEKWDSWTYHAFEPIPVWERNRIEKIHSFRVRVLQTPWPGVHPKLERALTTLAIAAEQAVNIFNQHSEDDPRNAGWSRAVRWYRAGYDSGQEERRRIQQEWDKWDSQRSHLVKEMCRAANWVADEVRHSINPRYLVERGRFTLAYLNETIGVSRVLLDYTDEEKSQLPKNFRLEPKDDDKEEDTEHV